MSKCLAKMSTSLPLPSSPHWQPNTPETWLSDLIRSKSSPFSSLTPNEEVTAFTEQTITGLRCVLEGPKTEGWMGNRSILQHLPLKVCWGDEMGFESSLTDERFMLVWLLSITSLVSQTTLANAKQHESEEQRRRLEVNTEPVNVSSFLLFCSFFFSFHV